MSNVMQTILAALDSDVVKPYPSVDLLKNLFTKTMQAQTGTVTGTAAVALPVSTDGDPKVVIVVNTNTGIFGVKVYAMAGAFAAKIEAAFSYADDMITLGTDGFTVGVDADLNTNHTLVWAALI